MGYGILAKDPEAESVDGLSIWAQNQNTPMSIANDDWRNKQSCIHFFYRNVLLWTHKKIISVRPVLGKGLSSLPGVECSSVKFFNLAEHSNCLFQTLYL